MRRRTFEEFVVPKPKTRLTDVVTTLRHFGLVTYTIDPALLRAQLPPGLSPLTIDVDGASRALLSVVLFMNSDFRSAVVPVPRFTMPQINYRAYVIDERTGDHGIWFWPPSSTPGLMPYPAFCGKCRGVKGRSICGPSGTGPTVCTNRIASHPEANGLRRRWN